MNMIQKNKALRNYNQPICGKSIQSNEHPHAAFINVADERVSTHKKKIPSKVLNTKQSLYLKGLHTAVTAKESDDVQQLQYLLPSIRHSLQRHKKYTCSEETFRGWHSKNLLNYSDIFWCRDVHENIRSDCSFL